jgi:hypothetical protein
MLTKPTYLKIVGTFLKNVGRSKKMLIKMLVQKMSQNFVKY